MTHICVGKLTIIGLDNGLSPGRREAIILTTAELLLIRHLGTKLSEILIEIQNFSFTKMHLKISSAKWRPFCLGPNVLKHMCLHVSYSIVLLVDKLLPYHKNENSVQPQYKPSRYPSNLNAGFSNFFINTLRARQDDFSQTL